MTSQAANELFDIDRARSLSVQQPAQGGDAISIFSWMVRGSYLIPPWWTASRDVSLREFWKKADHLAGAVYTMTSKMTAIPFRVTSIDPSNQRWVQQAEERQNALTVGAEFGQGWQDFYSPFVEDLITQDNGAFAEIIGPGDPAGPIEGAPITIAHLDSNRCVRTGDPEYPVIYTARDGKKYRLHYTRVIMMSQMPSPIETMNGVGFCAVSRCVNVAQNLLDILTYKQEKLGSRPHRFIIITKGGLDPMDLRDAFAQASIDLDSMGLTRYSRGVIVGSQSIRDADAKVLELAGLPDGFNEETSITLGMATIALAFGVDARELFPSMSGGASRADALLQHLKQRGKGPGQIIQSVEQAINYKFLPRHLRISFDFQDDAEDRQSAEIRQTRAQMRERDILSGTTTVRVTRQRMVSDGEINQAQFEDMELADGRLPDGASIFSLFYSEPELDLGVEYPDNAMDNDPDIMLSRIAAKKSEINKQMAGEKSHQIRRKLLRYLVALEALRKLYMEPLPIMQVVPEDGMDNGSGENTDGNLPRGMRGDRMRLQNLARPNPGVELNPSTEIAQGKDENPNVKGGDATELMIQKAIQRVEKYRTAMARGDATLTTPTDSSVENGI